MTNPETLQFSSYPQYIEQYLQCESTLYIIFGTDLGIFPTILENYPCPDGTRYIFIELDEIFELSVKNVPETANSPVYIVGTNDWYNVAQALDLDSYLHTESVKLFKSLNAATNNAGIYAAMIQKTHETLTFRANELRSQTIQDVYQKNTLLNAVDNIYPAKMLEDTASGTALVIGAGPSLDDHLQWIHDNQHRFTVIAASRLWQALSFEGINVDIVVSSDPMEANYEQSKAMLAARDIIFVQTNHVNPRLLAQWHGPSFFLEDRFPWTTENNPENIDAAGPSVVHDAIHIATKMGFEQILLCGVDLCFPDKGRSHSITQSGNIRQNMEIVVETYSGEIAKTDFGMRLGIKTLGEIAKGFDGHIYNLSDQSAMVEGVLFNPSPKLPDTKCRLPSYAQPTKSEIQSHIDMVDAELYEAKAKYSEIQLLCQQAIALNNAVSTRLSPEEFEQNQVKIDEIEDLLNSQYARYLPFLQKMAGEDLVKLLKQSDKLEKSPEERQEWIGKYYTAYLKSIDLIINEIKRGKETVYIRSLEYHTESTPESLFETWKKTGNLGRCCNWMKTHKDLSINYEIKQKINSSCNFFEEEISFDRKIQSHLGILASTDPSDIPRSLRDQILLTKDKTKSSKLRPQPLALYVEFIRALEKHFAGDVNSALAHYLNLPQLIDPTERYFTQYVMHGVFKALLQIVSNIDITKSEELKKMIIKKISDFSVDEMSKKRIINILKQQIPENTFSTDFRH